MKISIYCKASTHIGLGHLIRSFALAKQFVAMAKGAKITFSIIGDVNLKKLVQYRGVSVKAYNSENEIAQIEYSELLILDMIEIGQDLLDLLVTNCELSVVLSPVFNCYDKIDYYFGRTKYLNFEPSEFPKLRIYAGLDYAIIQDGCIKISAGTFEDNLNLGTFPIAVIMGGGDATNKTLEVLRALKKCTAPATFWVMVGEGYKYSLDELSDEIRRDTTHEIILAKTNTSMWRILNNCVLCILPGGVTSFEAVYAGLPAINFFDNSNQEFLIREITESGAAYNFGVYSEQALDRICAFIDKIYLNRKELLQMHVSTKSLIDGKGSERIVQILLTELIQDGRHN